MKTKWDLEKILLDKPDIKKYLKEVEENILEFRDKWKSREDYLKDPQILKQALVEYEQLMKKKPSTGSLGYYYHLKKALDQENPELIAAANQLNDQLSKIGNEIEFFMHGVSKIPAESQYVFLKSAHLKEYKHFLETSFKEAKYLLSEDEEKIINRLSGVAYGNWVRMTNQFLSSSEKEIQGKKANFSEIISKLDDIDKRVRDEAAQKFNVILKENINAATVEINSVLQYKKINDDMRNITRPDLTRHIADDISTEVVDEMLEVVVSRYDQSKKYYEIKSKILGVPKLEYHERNVEIGELQKKFTFEESADLVNKVFENLDPLFSTIFKTYLQNGQVDVFSKKGKVHGAFCTQPGKEDLVYVLLNHDNKLNDVTTIAHEFGHAINHHLVSQKQNALNGGVPLSIAEVASTFMEDFVLDELLKECNEKEKEILLMSKLNSDISSIHRQVACYKFEQELHQKYREIGYLSKDQLGEIFRKHMSAYMGNFVEQSKGSENWWVYWSHIRRFFYVYSYASGLLISKSLQNMVKQDKDFIKNIIELFSIGSKKSPKNAFLDLGIDIANKEFWNNGLAEIDKMLEATSL